MIFHEARARGTRSKSRPLQALLQRIKGRFAALNLREARDMLNRTKTSQLFNNGKQEWEPYYVFIGSLLDIRKC